MQGLLDIPPWTNKGGDVRSVSSIYCVLVYISIFFKLLELSSFTFYSKRIHRQKILVKLDIYDLLVKFLLYSQRIQIKCV